MKLQGPGKEGAHLSIGLDFNGSLKRGYEAPAESL